MISITSYHGNSASAENNAKVVTVNGTKFFFSYETLVAVQTKDELKVLQNYWGPTTGKHLNAIDSGDKDNRLDRDAFNDFVNTLRIAEVETA